MECLFFESPPTQRTHHLEQDWCWVVQTFLQTKQAGLNVELANQPVANSICIAHYNATKNKVWPPNCFVVGIRSDTPPLACKRI